MSLLGVLLGLVVCFGVFIWWWQRSSILYWKKNKVSYIPGLPFIGVFKDVVLFKKHIGELMIDLYNDKKSKDEPITGVYFFHQPSLIIRDPELIKNILVKDFSTFIDRGIKSDPHDVIGRDNLLTATGDRWRIIRKKLSPFLSTGKLKNFFLFIDDICKSLDEKLSVEIGKEPRNYDLKILASHFTIDCIASCAFGIQANSLQVANGEFYRKSQKAFEFNWKRGFQFAACFFFPKLAELLRFRLLEEETYDFLRSTVSYAMEERVKSGTKRNDMIDLFISMNEEDPKNFALDTLTAQAAIFLIAGYDSASSAIAFALYELQRHPAIQEKLRKEIMDYAEKYGALQYETINEMEYLHCVVQEIIRLYPSASFLNRVCSPPNGEESYSLEPLHKFAIPRGMPIYIPAIAIQRDPKYFPNPMEFIPERFSAENQDSINQYSYLAFSHGPRNCIGTRLAYFMVKMALFTTLSKYRVEANARTPQTIELDKQTLVMRSLEPLYMDLIKIKQD